MKQIEEKSGSDMVFKKPLQKPIVPK